MTLCHCECVLSIYSPCDQSCHVHETREDKTQNKNNKSFNDSEKRLNIILLSDFTLNSDAPIEVKKIYKIFETCENQVFFLWLKKEYSWIAQKCVGRFYFTFLQEFAVARNSNTETYWLGVHHRCERDCGQQAAARQILHRALGWLVFEISVEMWIPIVTGCLMPTIAFRPDTTVT